VLRAQHADVELKVVGTGDEMPRMIERANRMRLNGSVRFLGAVPDEELSRLYRECDVFALPSKGEGFGIVFLEAMRWGKPCIGGNHGGTPEVVIDGETGYLVEHGDSDRLGSCLLNLLESPDLRHTMGAAAYDKVRRNYIYSRMRDDWFSVIDEAMCNRPQ
jgi:glycosyltransferase involved in cell wall biosynthesis